MNLDWVRSIAGQCEEFEVAHFFKQYYKQDQGVPVSDGLLDGESHQEWPVGETSVYPPPELITV